MSPIEPPPSRNRARLLSAALRSLPFGHQTAMRMVARSLGNADHFWACFDGFLWRVDVSDFFMSGGIVWRGIHEPVVTLMLRALLKPGDVFLDAVMKMDIEGAKLAALRGAAHLLTEQRIHHIILELHTAVLSREDAQTTMRLIADAGYSCRRLLTERDAELGRRALGAAPDADRWSIPYDPHAPWTADWAPTFWWTAP